MAIGQTLETTRTLALPQATEPRGETAADVPPVDTLSRAAVAVVVIGALWRLTRYALCFPIWGDEAMLCLNLVNRDLDTILEPLNHGQVAPSLFVLGEWLCYRLLGSSEWSLRLFPLLAGLLSLPLFWILARTLLPRTPALFALALLSVSIWPATMAASIKPYSGDLFWTLLLLAPAANLLHRPNSQRSWACLIVVTPVALLASFPALFTAGAVCLCLLPMVWRSRSLRTWSLLMLFVGVMLTAFTVNYLLVIAQTPSQTREYMHWYWRDGFPPSHPAAFLLWLVKAHTGQMLAYPLGSANGGSILTFLLATLGAVALVRAGRGRIAAFCLAPFGLSLTAAILGRYPYGDSCRLVQHLAPGICLLAAMGISHLIARRPTSIQDRTWLAALVLLACIGIAGLGRDLIRPYRGEGDLWTRNVLREVFDEIRPEDQVLIYTEDDPLSAACHWYLLHQHTPIAFLNDSAAEKTPGDGNVWCLNLHFTSEGSWRPKQTPTAIERLHETLTARRPKLQRQPPRPYILIEKSGKRELIQYCNVHLWTR